MVRHSFLDVPPEAIVILKGNLCHFVIQPWGPSHSQNLLVLLFMSHIKWHQQHVLFSTPKALCTSKENRHKTCSNKYQFHRLVECQSLSRSTDVWEGIIWPGWKYLPSECFFLA